VTYNGNEKSRLVATVKQHVSCEFLSIRKHVTIFSLMLTAACCLVVRLGI